MDSDTETDFSEVESDCEYDLCVRQPAHALPFDPTLIENVILTIADKFNFRVIINSERARNAVLITTGLTLAGTLIGKHYGGKVGAAVGGAVGGVCGVGIAVVSMRDIWNDIKSKLSELFDIVYDYLAGLGINDYKNAALFLMQHRGSSEELAKLILQITSETLGKKVLSNIVS